MNGQRGDGSTAGQSSPGDGSTVPRSSPSDGSETTRSTRSDGAVAPPRVTRRALLGGGVAGLAVALAGCLGGGDDSDEGDGDDTGDGDDQRPGEAFELAGDGGAAFRDWLVPDGIDGDDADFICEYIDFETAVEEGVTQFDATRENVADFFDIEPEAISGELVVMIPEIQETGLLYFGEFDTETVVSTLEANDLVVLDEFEGYTVVGEERDGTPAPWGAVGADAILQTPWATGHLDAAVNGEGRLDEEDEDVALLLDLLPAGVRTGIRYHPNLDDIAVTGETGTAYDGNTVARSVRAFVFETASDASLDRAHEIIDGGSGSDEVFTEEVHGRAVMVEYAPPTVE